MRRTGFDPKTVTRAHGERAPLSLPPTPTPGKASTWMCSRLMDTSLKRFLRNVELRGKGWGVRKKIKIIEAIAVWFVVRQGEWANLLAAVYVRTKAEGQSAVQRSALRGR